MGHVAVCLLDARPRLPRAPRISLAAGKIGKRRDAMDPGDTLALVYVVGGSASLLLCTAILLCFAGTPAISRFPGSMLGWRLICDVLLSLQLVLLNLPRVLVGGSPGRPSTTVVVRTRGSAFPHLEAAVVSHRHMPTRTRAAANRALSCAAEMRARTAVLPAVALLDGAPHRK